MQGISRVVLGWGVSVIACIRGLFCVCEQRRLLGPRILTIWPVQFMLIIALFELLTGRYLHMPVTTASV